MGVVEEVVTKKVEISQDKYSEVIKNTSISQDSRHLCFIVYVDFSYVQQLLKSMNHRYSAVIIYKRRVDFSGLVQWWQMPLDRRHRITLKIELQHFLSFVVRDEFRMIFALISINKINSLLVGIPLV